MSLRLGELVNTLKLTEYMNHIDIIDKSSLLEECYEDMDELKVHLVTLPERQGIKRKISNIEINEPQVNELGEIIEGGCIVIYLIPYKHTNQEILGKLEYQLGQCHMDKYHWDVVHCNGELNYGCNDLRYIVEEYYVFPKLGFYSNQGGLTIKQQKVANEVFNEFWDAYKDNLQEKSRKLSRLG